MVGILFRAPLVDEMLSRGSVVKECYVNAEKPPPSLKFAVLGGRTEEGFLRERSDFVGSGPLEIETADVVLDDVRSVFVSFLLRLINVSWWTRIGFFF